MNENLYASPLPVEEEFVLDEITRRNARSLRITAIGLAVMSVGMVGELAFLLTIHGWLSVVGYTWTNLLMGVSLGLILFGLLLCLACRHEVARYGRGLVLASLLMISASMTVLLGGFFVPDFSLVEAVFTVGFLVMNIFFWQLARTMKIRRVGWIIGLAMVMWLWITLFMIGEIHSGDWRWILGVFQLSRDAGTALLMACFVPTILSQWLLYGAIFHRLRPQKTENRHE